MDAGEEVNQLKSLTDDAPERHDLFIALVSPIGASREEVLKLLGSELGHYDYAVEHIRLSTLLDDVQPEDGPRLPDRSEPDYYERRMDAGDRLRESAGDMSALAALAIARVAQKREPGRESDAERHPTAFVFDSLKHPREAQLMRAVYGSGFWLVSIVQDLDERKRNLADEIAQQNGQFAAAADARAFELIGRDEADHDAKHGQQVRDVFAEADYFLPVSRGTEWGKHVERLIQGIFDSPFLTPAVNEEAMRHAKAASLRSAALGRQVGAVIVPASGDPYIHGTNEVPKPGGGQFREGDSPDFRDFKTGIDPNPNYVNRLLREVFERLAKARYFSEQRNATGGSRVMAEALSEGILDGTRAKSLIEFTRCLHAEQAAIVTAARTGTAIQNAKLYTTTFPCHECTKFIVGAGIVEVYYVEPYPKSMAGDLYRDLIDSVPPLHDGSTAATPTRVPFRPFVGFGPGRYDEVFAAGKRRDGNEIAAYTRSTARPIGRGWNGVGVKNKEDQVVVIVAANQQGAQNTVDSSRNTTEQLANNGEPKAQGGAVGT